MSGPDDWNNAVIAEFRANGGKVGGEYEGAPLLLLHTVGARTGLVRVSPLLYRKVGDCYAVCASNAGAPFHPGWYHNLVANPDVRAEIGAETLPLTARVTSGGERDTIWAAQKIRHPGYVDYEARTSRRIPVVMLEPVGSVRRQPAGS